MGFITDLEYAKQLAQERADKFGVPFSVKNVYAPSIVDVRTPTYSVDSEAGRSREELERVSKLYGWSALCWPTVLIPQMQDAIRAKGYQWVEHIFNDGRQDDCILWFSLSRNPHALNDHPAYAEYLDPNRLGWGRYPRYSAWRQAYDYLVLGIREEGIQSVLS